MARLRVVAFWGVLSMAGAVEAQFTNVTGASGLGTAGRKDGGVGWGDFNDDGCLDVLVNTDQGGVNSFLYMQNNVVGCAGTFADVTACLAPGLQATGLERGAIWGDINNDGYADFARNSSSGIEVYLNNGPGSTPCGAGTLAWSVFGVGGNPSQIINSTPIGFNSEGIGWVDYDADGDLDLLWVNHQSLIAFGNDGNGNLTYVDNAVNGLPGDRTSKTGDYAAFADIDADGDVDWLARLENNTDLWINNGGTFSTTAFDEAPLNNNKGGVAFCDFDGDGDFDFFWTDAGVNQIWEQTGLGSTSFTARGVPLGITGDIDGVACGDIDNDADVDLLLTSDVNDHLFRNDGGLTFTDIAPAGFGADDGEGAALADYDRDGDLDLLINQDNANELWRNDTNNANYLLVRALHEDTVKLTTRDALGATVTLLDCQGNLMAPIREVNGGSGHGTQDSPYVHFGLPLAGTPSGPTGEYIVRVEFVGGGIVGKAVVPANIVGGYQLVTVTDTDANDFSACTTAVDVASFEAEGFEGGIELRWQTASELDNLGFHLYRAETDEGPYTRITERPIPGLGTSLSGGGYTYLDEGLSNGATFYYELEDIETTGRTERHGPVSATAGPRSAEAPGPRTPGVRYGDPDGMALRVLRPSEDWLVVELDTPGFFAELRDDGRVLVRVPGFGESFRGLPALGYRLEREGILARVEPVEVIRFSTMTPVLDSEAELIGHPTGTVRRAERAPASVTSLARVLGDSLQLSPFVWNADTGELRLAVRLRVRVRVRRARVGRSRGRTPRDLVARLETREPGLYVFDISKLAGGRGRAPDVSSLRLSRLGSAVPYHSEGSALYFLSAGAGANPFEHRAVYELELGEPRRMETRPASPEGPRVPFYYQRWEREEQRLYQPGLLNREDRWLWDLLFAPQRRDYGLPVPELAKVTEASVLSVSLQGASDTRADPDHHVRIFVNDSLVGEIWWDGKRSRRIESNLAPGSLRETGNVLTIENVGDTDASYSMVMLDRFALEYPRRPIIDQGILEGRFTLSGTVELQATPLVLDVTDVTPVWLEGGLTGFRSEPDRRYLVVSRDAVREPAMLPLPGVRLSSHGTEADYVVIGPRELLHAAKPLLDRRRRQGLRVLGVPIEELFAEFGYGEARPEAVAAFLEFASPHYVLLLGDATYDPKDYLGTAKPNFVPARMVRTDHLWTASDPSYAMIDHDEVPAVALGRIPAASIEDVEAIVAKILRYESESQHGNVVLVTDNPDRAGDFDSDARSLTRGVLQAEAVHRTGLSWQSASAVREEIRRAFLGDTKLLSYLGHGGIHLWADENVWNLSDVRALEPGEGLPLVLTMNCLNGYFHFPYFDALGEALVTAPDSGAIAAVSPSGLSPNGPAHVFHESFLEQILHGGHERLGDTFLAAQREFARKSSYKELLRLYHLFGDPALVTR